MIQLKKHFETHSILRLCDQIGEAVGFVEVEVSAQGETHAAVCSYMQNGTNQDAGSVIKANCDQYDGSESGWEGRIQRDGEE